MNQLGKTLFFSSLLINKVLRRTIPLTVIINITDRCNLSCDYCYAGYHNRRKNELSTDQIYRIIDELARIGCKRISIGGGEPLLRPDLKDIIGRIKKNKLLCTVNTNGILVPDKIADIKNVDALCISLDGDEEAHDSLRGKGSFSKAIKAIECAKKNKLPVHTNTVLHKFNLDKVAYVLELATKYNMLAEFNICIAYLIDKDKTVALKGDNIKIKEALGKIIELKQKGHPVLFSQKALSLALNWPDYSIEAIADNPPNHKYAKCSAGKFFCVIDTDGSVYACPHLIGKQTPGNAVEDNIKVAIADISRHDCLACYQVYHNEFNLLYGLDISVILNYIMNEIKFSA